MELEFDKYLLEINKYDIIHNLINKEFEKYHKNIINFLNINHKNILSIKNKNYNLLSIDNFYGYVNNKKLNKLISHILGQIYNKYSFDNTLSILTKETNINELNNDELNNNELNNNELNNNELNNNELNKNILLNLNNNGIHIFENLLNIDLCNNILMKINNKNFIKKNNKINKFDNVNIYNTENGILWIKSQKDIIMIDEIQKIVADPLILNIAQDYLDCKPILVQTNFWISKYGSVESTHSFHQDYDDVNFLKIFIYLCDVDDNNGPHFYVKSSLNNMITPKGYKPSDRLSDNYINKNYKKNVLKICGKKGTIIFEDTNGFHKGSPLKKKDSYRFMLQLEYGCSTKIFDNKISFINNLNKEDNKILYEAKQKYPDTFILYNFE
jgi:hypothetical protein